MLLASDDRDGLGGRGETSVLKDLVVEIQRSVEFSLARQPAVSRVGSKGGSVRIKNPPERLNKELHVPVALVDPFSVVKGFDIALSHFRGCGSPACRRGVATLPLDRRARGLVVQAALRALEARHVRLQPRRLGRQALPARLRVRTPRRGGRSSALSSSAAAAASARSAARNESRRATSAS